MRSDIQARHQVIETARELTRLGLNHGMSGNVSVRVEDGFLVTPSGVPTEALSPFDLPAMDMQGNWTGPLKPSSEWRFHRDILVSRSEFNAVIHTHAPFCTSLAVHGRGIPPFHYMVAMLGGRDIRCAPYATYGTQELSDHALAALDGRRACLLAHHGMIVCGADLEDALDKAVELEHLAQAYWQALQLGEPPHLPEEEMDKVIEKFKTYGRNAQKG